MWVAKLVEQRRRLARLRAEGDAGEMEERPGIDGHGHLGRLGPEVEGVGEGGRPIARRLHHFLEPRQVVLGAPPERRVAGRQLVLELHQLRRGLEGVEQLGIVEALELDLRLVGHIGPGRSGDEAGQQADKEQEGKALAQHLLPNARRRRSLAS